MSPKNHLNWCALLLCLRALRTVRAGVAPASHIGALTLSYTDFLWTPEGFTDWTQRVLIPLPPACKAGTLPFELWALFA